MTKRSGHATHRHAGRLAGVVLVPYLRVSTRDQLDGFGLDTQERQARAFARRHGARLIAPCVDAALTGTDTLDREGLSCALAAVQEGRVDGMLVPSLSRLARRLDVQEAVLALVWQYGGRVFTVEDDGAEVRQDDPDDPMRTFVRQVMGAVHQLDAATVAKRLRDGRKTKADRGGYAGGAPPYGYRAEGRALVPDPAEITVLARMRQWAGNGLSRRAIAARLNAEGVPTKRGGRWHPTTVSRALSEAAREADRRTSARQRAWKAEEKARRHADRAAVVAGVQR
jgi:DNA invertase Pin-like site-specific DNA recombinase